VSVALDVARRADAHRHPAVPVGVAVAALLVLGLVALPPVYLVIRGLALDPERWDLVLRRRSLDLAWNTLALAAVVTAGATVLGLAAAWLAVRTDLPARRLWATLFALPLVFPSYVGTFAILAFAGPRGILQRWLEPLGVERLPDLASLPGAALVLTLFTYPYVYLVAAAGLRGLDPSWEEAARTLGRGRWETFRRVTLPLLRPSVSGGALLVALYVLHDFGAVSLLRYPTFTQAIFLAYRGTIDRAAAAVLSLLLLAMAVLVVVAERRARGRRARYHRAGRGTDRPPRLVLLGRWRWPALAASGALVALALALPAGMLVHLLLRGLAEGVPLNLTLGAVGGSALVASLGAVATVLAALPVAVVAVRGGPRLARMADGVAWLGYALPGLVVALAFVFLTARLPPLYQSLPLVVAAYVVLFLPQAVEPLRGALLRLDPRLEEAGRTLGRTRGQVLRRVVVPAVLRPALAGAALVCLTAMKELPATMLLRPTGFETLATRVWTSASAGLYSRAAVPALLLVVVACVPLWALAGRLGVREAR
jgi:iron(III) transport system permease protein